MNELEDGILLRGNPETWTAGSSFNFKLDFLASARNMAAPEVAYLGVRHTGTVNSSVGTDASGFDAAKLCGNFRFTDKDLVVDCSGQTLRLNGMIEMGERWTDMTTLAAAAADATRTWTLWIPFYLEKSERPRDTTIPLEHFLEGGQIEYTCGALPTGWDGFTGTVRLVAVVFDGRRKELKSRLVLREQAMTLQEHYYDVYGSIRTLVGTSKLATTSASSWAAFTTFNSQTLRFPASIESDLLVDKYRFQSIGFHASDPILAATPLAVAFVTPDGDQKIGSMIDAKTVHLDLGAAPPTGARLFSSVIRDRNPELAALVAGYANVADYQAALEATGTVVSAKGKNGSARAMIPALVRRLPLRVGGA